MLPTMRAVCRVTAARLPSLRFGAIGARAASSAVPPHTPSAPLLFTPGPLTTSAATKSAMQVDLGSRDSRFLGVVEEVEKSLLALAGVSHADGYECVLLQGSGTYAVEAVFGSAVPRTGAKVLVAHNGAYGRRMLEMLEVYGIDAVDVPGSEARAVSVADVMTAVRAHDDVTHVAVVHHETTTGILNPVHELGQALAAARPDVVYFVDSMSAFGAYPVDMRASNISYLVSSANKLIEGVPGFSYALCRREHLETCAGNARSLSLDLVAQWRGMQANRQFRFTPPTHALLAFRSALAQHQEEGGCAGRLARYRRNFDVLQRGMAALGLHTYVEPADQSCIVATFLYPDDPAFDFTTLYTQLADRGLVIYPGKLTQAPCFRVGCIGQVFEADVQAVVDASRDSLEGMGVALPVTQVVPEVAK